VRLLERAGILFASLALSIGLIALLSGFFADRDQPSLAGASAPGQHFRDLGDARLAPGQLRPAYNSDPPTSGAHVPQPVVRDESPLSDDQLLTALAAGDVVIVYGGAAPPPRAIALAKVVAAPFTPALAAAGQAVILSPLVATRGLIALAWTRMLRVGSASDPALRAFVSYWLGRGAR
jgi:hypothetical protein